MAEVRQVGFRLPAWRRVLHLVVAKARALRARLRYLQYRILGIRFTGYANLGRIEVPRRHHQIAIAARAALENGVTLLVTCPPADDVRLSIGRSAYVNRWTMFDASERIEVGEGTMIGPYCYITDHDHGTAPGVAINTQPLWCEPVRIGRGVWIGARATILKGVQIGDGAVIGAGSVVTRSVGPGEKWAGVPARLIGVR